MTRLLRNGKLYFLKSVKFVAQETKAIIIQKIFSNNYVTKKDGDFVTPQCSFIFQSEGGNVFFKNKVTKVVMNGFEFLIIVLLKNASVRNFKSALL